MYTRFYLQNPRKEELSYILIKVKLSKGDYYRTYVPGQKIAAKHWNKKKYRVKSSHRGHNSINTYLDYLQREIDAIRRTLDMTKRLNQIEAEMAINVILNKTESEF